MPPTLQENAGDRPRPVPPDEELFDAYCRGDEQSFITLFNRHKEVLYTFCYRMLGDSDRAADAFQEAFIRVFRFRTSYQSSRPFRNWLFTIARNVCSTMYRTERGHASLDDIADDPAVAAIPESLDFTDRDLLAEVLSRLPALSREALLLYEYEGFSYEEIAAMTDSGLSTVKMRIHRARNQLRAMLKPWLHETRKESHDDV